MGNFITWDAGTGKIVQSQAEKFSVWSGALNTAGGISCYGTLEGYLKCVDKKDINKELFKFKTPSGIIGNVFTYEHKGKQYIGVFSGIGGWAGIGMAAGLEKDTDGLGAVGGYRELNQYTELGGSLTVFALPELATNYSAAVIVPRRSRTGDGAGDGAVPLFSRHGCITAHEAFPRPISVPRTGRPQRIRRFAQATSSAADRRRCTRWSTATRSTPTR